MRWTLKPKPDQTKVEALKTALQVDDIIASLLVQRGIKSYDQARQFFRPSLNDLHDPYLMKDMDKAVERIELALNREEHILIYGDYDVDGTTAVALLSSYLKTRTDLVSTYIPDRYTEGYGISKQGIDYAHDNDFTLIIALDCGIKAIDKVAYANEKNIDFIICDHHRPGPELPEAVAILDPKRDDCKYPYKELCGCGVGFKLIQSLSRSQDESIDELVEYLDLVATAIAADIVPITGENRVLAYFGMQIINTSPRQGIKAILQQSKKNHFTITDVVFIVAPRINAAGRMKHGNHAVTLLTENDYNLAAQYAIEIDKFNTSRRAADKQTTLEALAQIEQNNEQERLSTVVYKESWHKGVIGIVASRLTETYYRPTLVFTKSGDALAASARSVKGFDVYEAIEACSELIEQFGGHKYAAGLTLHEDNYENFKEKFEHVVTELIDKSMLVPELAIDAEINFNQISQKFYRILSQFAPFGPGNMMPVFMTGRLRDTGYAKCVGEDDKHLKATLTSDGRFKIGAIGFNLGPKKSLLSKGNYVKAAYTLDENHWNGTSRLQIKLRDIKKD